MVNQHFSPKLLCVCALQAEAQPLIAYYRLKAAGVNDSIAGGTVGYRDGGFRLYQNDRMVLVVSGIGKINAAAATAHALAQMPAGSIALNIGIAGSDNQLGEIFVAHCIRTDERSFYPPMTFNSELPGITVHSVEKPCIQYQNNTAFDMEASAFVSIARRYVVAELVHSLKIISDNSDHPLIDASGEINSWFDKNTIATLVESRISQIVNFIDELFLIASELPAASLSATMDSNESVNSDTCLYELIETMHFTNSQSKQLQEILNRFRVLGVVVPQTLPNMGSGKNKASALIACLDQMLGNVYPNYESSAKDLSDTVVCNDKSFGEISRD